LGNLFAEFAENAGKCGYNHGTQPANHKVGVMRTYSQDFRKAETQYLYDRWFKSQSCVVTGVGSIGKSNFLQHVTNPATLEYHRGRNSAQVIPIILDANLLGALEPGDSFRCWAGYELILHRVYMTFYPFDVLQNDAQNFHATYVAIQDGASAAHQHMGLRYLELGLTFFFRRQLSLVFVLDEFESFLANLPPVFFQSLRGLRDLYKHQLSYTLFTRTSLKSLVASRSDRMALEPFADLFADHQYYIGPYNKLDAYAMLESIATNPILNTSAAKDYVYQQTGGFAGLMRAVTHIINRSDSSDNYSELASRYFHRSTAIQIECANIFNSLETQERDALRIIVNSPAAADSIDQETIDTLVQKRLLKVTAQSISVEPMLLASYIRRNQE
jgi:hypothetical protein